MIRFEHVWILWLLLLVPAWIAVLAFTYKRRRQAAARFVSEPLLERVARTISSGRARAKNVLWIIAWTLLVCGAAGPQVGTRLEEVKREGIDVVLAVDLSNSMMCQDLTPSRLENAKQEMLTFVNGLKGDRIGIVAFAGTAFIHCPLTTDYGAVKLLLRVLKPDLVQEQGTALADAIESARKAFNTPEVKSRVLVIITDGEDHEEQAVDVARKAAEEGIRVYTIGMGTPQGAPIPVKDKKGADAGFKRDKSGAVIVTRLNDILLEKIAEAGNGQYLRGTQSGQELAAIWNDISTMEKKEYGKKQFTSFENRFQYLVLPALLLLFGEFFLSERKGHFWISDIINRLKRFMPVRRTF
ncbi:VWA domain-containing protein [candidate division KSB1 bacterium]|nr:MAG: VWA domain-containing protein [candidate division KSB1 bacterium]